LAPLVSPGKAVGVDLSETMIAEAVQRSAHSSENLSFRVGSALELPFEAESFDRVLATQVLLDIPDPWTALAEMKRVLAPSGLMVMTEIDWGTLVVQSSDGELDADSATSPVRNCEMA
jgi:ubiquinone/menaquinone biosynthesis C-methylase UbiE